jgi:hypothetical protein
MYSLKCYYQNCDCKLIRTKLSDYPKHVQEQVKDLIDKNVNQISIGNLIIDVKYISQ